MVTAHFQNEKPGIRQCSVAAVAAANADADAAAANTSSSLIRIVRDTRYSGTLGCANLKVSQVPEVARAAEKRAAPFRGDGKRGETKV